MKFRDMLFLASLAQWAVFTGKGDPHALLFSVPALAILLGSFFEQGRKP